MPFFWKSKIMEQLAVNLIHPLHEAILKRPPCRGIADNVPQIPEVAFFQYNIYSIA
jgi:hypothetical protein